MLPNFEAQVADAVSYGLVAGYRFGQDGGGFGVIAFRWMRERFTSDCESESADDQSSRVTVIPAVGHYGQLPCSIFRTSSHWMRKSIPSSRTSRVSLGAATMGAPASSATRFAFGFGSGLKVFPSKHYGFRLGVDYMPIVMNAQLQSLVCVGGACSFALSGGIMNQFEVNLGPAFRF